MNRKILLVAAVLVVLAVVIVPAVATMPPRNPLPTGSPWSTVWSLFQDLQKQITDLKTQVTALATQVAKIPAGKEGPQGKQGPPGASVHFGEPYEIKPVYTDDPHEYSEVAQTDGFVTFMASGRATGTPNVWGAVKVGGNWETVAYDMGPGGAWEGNWNYNRASITMPVKAGMEWSLIFNNCNEIHIWWWPLTA